MDDNNLPAGRPKRGRPKGAQPAKTAAERMRKYRDRKAASGKQRFELTVEEKSIVHVALKQLNDNAPDAWKKLLAKLINEFA